MALSLSSASLATLRAAVAKIPASSFHGKAVRGLTASSVPATRPSVQCEASLESVSKTLTQLVGEKNVNKAHYAAILAANALVAMPAFAEEEKGKIFDFNLTLPIIAGQFLLLMLALDNIWFKPVSQVMDSRDENIRSKLLSVRDNSSEIKALQEEAESVIKAARVETQAALEKAKKETAAELDAELQESRKKIEAELESALENLVAQKEETLKSLDSKVNDLSEEIIKKLFPVKL